MPNNQRQHRSSHAPKDVLPYAHGLITVLRVSRSCDPRYPHSGLRREIVEVSGDPRRIVFFFFFFFFITLKPRVE